MPDDPAPADPTAATPALPALVAAVLADPARLAALDAYAILDTPAEADFDDVARLAAQVCAAPVAFVTFVNAGRQYFKAAVGGPAGGTVAPLDAGFCPLTVAAGRVLVIPNAAADPAHAGNPAVAGPAAVRFYAGAPLVTPDGQTIGTLCVVDPVARTLSADQQAGLEALGRQVVRLLELRRELARRDAAEAARAESDRRFRAAFDQTVMGMVEVDLAGRVVQANAAFCRLVGRPPAELVGRTTAGYTPAEDRARDADAIAGVGDGRGDRFAYDKRYERPDGSLVWARLMASAVRDDAGRVTSLIAAVGDVTDRRAANAALVRSRERFAQAVDGAGLGTFHWDLPVGPDTAYDWNPTLKAFFWLPPDAVAGPDVRRGLVHPDDHDRVGMAIDRAIATGGRYDEQYRIVGPAGQVRWLHARGQTSGGDPPTGFGGIVMDVTDARAATDAVRDSEAALRLLAAAERAARAEADRQGAVKDEFLATLSHELRTPLNAIMGWSQILNADLAGGGTPDDADVRDGLAAIGRNAAAQRQIIDDLLDMNRVVAGQMRMDVRPVDLGAVVRAAVETVRPAATAKAVRLHAVLDPAAGPVSGDPGRLQQVFWNVLSNAVKFTPKGGRVQVTLARADSHVEVAVTDTGQGIGPDFLPFVFDRFRQADGGATRRHGGLGLGLAIVKQLVELHGGSVRVHSGGPGQGSTFTVELPLTPVHPAGDAGRPREHPLTATPPPGAVPASRHRLTGVRVLVVDDEPDARRIVHRLLADGGAEVRTAGSAAEALAAFADGPPDVLVSDVGMPAEDGYALIAAVRRLPAAAGGRVPAVALTAFARAADRVKALSAGYEMHAVKPVEPAELIAIVASLAGRASG